MEISFQIWFPSYGLNKGYLSKVLRQNIGDITRNLGVQITDTYFEDLENFVINIELVDEENRNYVINLVKRGFGSIITENELSTHNKYLGRLVEPGKVGFGIFVDIGIRPKQEILLPLRELRKTFPSDNKKPLRKFVDEFGFVDGFPVEIEIIQVKQNRNTKEKKYDAKISESFSELIQEWMDEGLQKIIITKMFNSSVFQAVQHTQLGKYIEDIEVLDPLTTIITCKKRTRANGLIPKLGPMMGNAPMGIFDPSKIHNK